VRLGEKGFQLGPELDGRVHPRIRASLIHTERNEIGVLPVDCAQLPEGLGVGRVSVVHQHGHEPAHGRLQVDGGVATHFGDLPGQHDVSIQDRRQQGGEETGDVRARHSGRLKGIDIPEGLVPSLIDELPVILALAAVSEGTTRLRGAAELRVKESDRLAVMARGLETLGVSLTEYEDGIDIEGGEIQGGYVDGAGDHRCAMSFVVLGQIAGGEVSVGGSENIDTSYPGFVPDLLQVGGLVHGQSGGSGNVRRSA